MTTPTWSSRAEVQDAPPRLEPDDAARRLAMTLEAHGLLTWRALVLAWVIRHEELRVRDICAHLNLTERTVRRHLASLVDAGLLRCSKRGRRNIYDVAPELHRDLSALGALGGARREPAFLRLLEDGR